MGTATQLSCDWPEGFALAVADADDGVGDAVDADLFADGVAVAEQVVDDVVAYDDVLGGVVLVAGREAAADGDVDVVEREHRPGVAAHAGVVAGVPVGYDVGGFAQQRADFAAFGASILDWPGSPRCG